MDVANFIDQIPTSPYIKKSEIIQQEKYQYFKTIFPLLAEAVSKAYSCTCKSLRKPNSRWMIPLIITHFAKKKLEQHGYVDVEGESLPYDAVLPIGTASIKAMTTSFQKVGKSGKLTVPKSIMLRNIMGGNNTQSNFSLDADYLVVVQPEIKEIGQKSACAVISAKSLKEKSIPINITSHQILAKIPNDMWDYYYESETFLNVSFSEEQNEVVFKRHLDIFLNNFTTACLKNEKSGPENKKDECPAPRHINWYQKRLQSKYCRKYKFSTKRKVLVS